MWHFRFSEVVLLPVPREEARGETIPLAPAVSHLARPSVSLENEGRLRPFPRSGIGPAFTPG